MRHRLDKYITLQEKIISADVQLEETGMELESLELSNQELQTTIKKLEHEVKANQRPSLHSIHSDDLICLSKIRQLGEEELKLKHSIRELERREYMFREQMERILTSREYQKACGNQTMMKRMKELELNDKKMKHALQAHKSKMHQLKKKLARKKRELVSTI